MTLSLDAQTEDLFRRIQQKCQEREWFGGDEWMDPGFSTRPPFRTGFPLPATEEHLQHVELRLGFPFPPLLRALYLDLANGAFGFGYGILPAETVLREYRSHRGRLCFDGAWRWPEQLIPLCDWGCDFHSYLDVELGMVLFADTEALFNDEGLFLLEAPSLGAWLERWIAKQDQHPPFTRQRAEDEVDRDEPKEAPVAVWQWSVVPHADEMGREEPEDETDLQARAMGMESLEDDPHTPVPLYVREYRRLCGL